MKKSLFLSLGLVVSLVACGPRPEWEPNKELQQKIFLECLKSVPEGPRATHYNDWSEVVDSCSSVAYNQSLEKGYWKDNTWIPYKRLEQKPKQ